MIAEEIDNIESPREFFAKADAANTRPERIKKRGTKILKSWPNKGITIPASKNPLKRSKEIIST